MAGIDDVEEISIWGNKLTRVLCREANISSKTLHNNVKLLMKTKTAKEFLKK